MTRETFVNLLHLFAMVLSISAASIDNEIVGPLNITCQEGTALINFKTKNVFNGRVYIKGAYTKPMCNRIFHDAPLIEGNMTLPFNQCDTQTDRYSQNGDRGVKYVAVVVVSFHPTFITKVDRAFRIECIFKNGENLVTNNLDVNELHTESLVLSPTPPKCEYTLRLLNLTGPEARFANVGDTIYHRWTCDSDVHAIFVHSCFVKDSGQQQIALLDDSGCSLDEQVMPNLTYSKTLTAAWVQTHAFRYQDAASLRFSCKISTCLKSDSACLQNRPRQCLTVTKRRERRHRSVDDIEEEANEYEFDEQSLQSPPLHVTDLDEQIPNFDDLESAPNFNETSNVNALLCFNSTTVYAACAISLIFLFFPIMSLFILVIFHGRLRGKHQLHAY